MKRVKYAIVGAALLLTACATQSGDHPPALNSGSYDWRDQYYGPNGYMLPGWTNYLAMPK